MTVIPIILRKETQILIVLALTLVVHSCATMKGRRGHGFSLIISEDTMWSGKVDVDGVVLVRKGATLSIAPGTTVSFSDMKIKTEDEHGGFSGSGIKVEGRVVARGTDEDPITFTSARPAGPGAWDRLYFVFSKGNIFEHCVFQEGGYAIHAHFSQISITSSLFRRNIEGVRLGGSRVSIEDSVFTGNRVRGINFKESKNTISGCAIYKNGVGIFLHSRDSSSLIKNNAIYDNRRYDLQLGDLHEDDVDVSENWWGRSEPDYIDERVFDGRDQEGVGVATYAPALPKPRVKVSSVKGFLTFRKGEVQGRVYAIENLGEGFSDSGSLASTKTDERGAFNLFLPPGRFFIFAQSSISGRRLFGFTGGNPVALKPFAETFHVIPLVDIEGCETVSECGKNDGREISVLVTMEGEPVARSFAYLYPGDTLDIRGPGVSSGMTSREGKVTFRVTPGNYVVLARKRPEGQSLGIVGYGGLFGIAPHLPVSVDEGCSATVVVPVFVKEGIVSDEGGEARGKEGGRGFAFLNGNTAEDYMVYFYRTPRAVGRPEFVSGVIRQNGLFLIENIGILEEGVYFAFLRKSLTGTAGSSEAIAAGPVEVRIDGGEISPPVLTFE